MNICDHQSLNSLNSGLVQSFSFSTPQKTFLPTGLAKKSNRSLSSEKLWMSLTAENESRFQKSRLEILSQRQRRRKEQKGGDSSSTVEIKFVGFKTVTSPSVHSLLDNNICDISSCLNKYFTLEENRNLLFPANEAKPLGHPPTTTQLETWTKQAELGGGEGPVYLNWENTDGQEIILVNDVTLQQKIFKIKAPLQMPGLKVVSESTIGMKLLLTPPRSEKNDFSSSKLPEYQFSLLDSNLVAIGPTPLVWLFQKLMKYRESTASFTRVRAKIRDVNKSNEIMFVTEARLETSVRLPSKVLKILPTVDVSKFEKQGSDAIQKLLEKDLEPALNGFSEGFRSFSRNCSKIQNKASLNS